MNLKKLVVICLMISGLTTAHPGFQVYAEDEITESTEVTEIPEETPEAEETVNEAAEINEEPVQTETEEVVQTEEPAEVIEEEPVKEIEETDAEEIEEMVNETDPDDPLVPVVDVKGYRVEAVNALPAEITEVETGTEVNLTTELFDDEVFVKWDIAEDIEILGWSYENIRFVMPEADVRVVFVAGHLVTDEATGRPKLLGRDDEPITDVNLTIEKKKYHFGEDGVAIHGIYENPEDNEKYYFGEDGAMATGTQKVDGKLYYFRPDTGVMYRRAGWGNINGERPYFNADGSMKTGTQKIDGKLYYFKPSNGLKYHKAGWGNINGERPYFNEDGSMKTGTQKIGKYLYYFMPTTGLMYHRAGWGNINGERPYFNADGTMRTGIQKIGKYLYYFRPDNGLMYHRAGWGNINGERPYFNADGTMLTGIQKIGNNLYYFRPDNGLMYHRAGWGNINGERPYFNADGTLYTGWMEVGRKKYYFGKQTGLMYKGWNRVQDATYYFNKTNGEMYSNGTYSIDGKTCEFNPFGQYIDYDRYRGLSRPYWIKVNRAYNTVTVYGQNLEGQYVIPVKAFVCSVGMDGMNEDTGKKMETPIGETSIYKQRRWAVLASGETWGQYVSFIYWGQYSMHSVQYMVDGDPGSLAKWEYVKLGNSASNGCIRMVVRDVKWIYDNCPVGTAVKIFDDWGSPGPLGKPTPTYLNLDDWRSCWDPTDPDGNNPWRWY